RRRLSHDPWRVSRRRHRGSLQSEDGGLRAASPVAPRTSFRIVCNCTSFDFLLVVAMGTRHNLARWDGLRWDQPELAGLGLPLLLQLGRPGQLRARVFRRLNADRGSTILRPLGQHLLNRGSSRLHFPQQRIEGGFVCLGERYNRVERRQDLALLLFGPAANEDRDLLSLAELPAEVAVDQV